MNDVERLDLQQQLEAERETAEITKLCQQRNELTASLNKLQEQLGCERELNQRLQSKCAEQGELIAALWDKVFPPGKVNHDLKNYPPPDQCFNLADLLPELQALSQAVREQHGK